MKPYIIFLFTGAILMITGFITMFSFLGELLGTISSGTSDKLSISIDDYSIFFGLIMFIAGLVLVIIGKRKAKGE